jgi:hypothetical protein
LDQTSNLLQSPGWDRLRHVELLQLLAHVHEPATQPAQHAAASLGQPPLPHNTRIMERVIHLSPEPGILNAKFHHRRFQGNVWKWT